MNAPPETYPRERIPKNAVLCAAAFRGVKGTAPVSFLDAGRSNFVASGSMAIRLALVQAGIGPGDSVLLPAYHCISMVEPVVACGARPVFYRIGEDTSVDLADVAAKLDATARVLLVPHYFGFPQDATRVRAFCDEHGLLYLEDCAHAFFGSHAGRPLGSFGDYAIASPWKFFPTFDGGLLVTRHTGRTQPPVKTPGMYLHCKAALNMLEYAFEYRRLRALKTALSLPLRAKSRLWQRHGGSMPPEAGLQDMPAPDADWSATGMSLPSRLTIARANMSYIATQRRRNYQRLDHALRGVPGLRPLFAALPDTVVPQVYPMLVESAERVFPALKRRGVPIIRFGEYLWPAMPRDTCPQTLEFSRKVFQFPCHQDLRSDELQWMVETIVGVMEQA